MSPAGRSRKRRRSRTRAARCWRAESLGQRGASARLRGPRGERGEVDGAALRMEIELALGELGHFRRAAGDGDARDRMRAQIFQQAADEIAHVDQRVVGQPIELADGPLGRVAGRRADMLEAARARHVHAAMDRVNPGRARIGHDDAGGAEDRQAADDAEPPVGGAQGDFLSARHRDFDHGVGADAEPLGDFGEIGADHRARRRIDGGLAGRQRQAGPGHRADALAGLENDPRARRRQAHRRHDQRAVGDVGIVARVLDDGGAGEIVAQFMGREREFRPEALGQRDRNRVGKRARQQRLEGGARRAAGAGAGRPSAPQRRIGRSLAHRRWSRWRRPSCLERANARGQWRLPPAR